MLNYIIGQKQILQINQSEVLFGACSSFLYLEEVGAREVVVNFQSDEMRFSIQRDKVKADLGILETAVNGDRETKVKCNLRLLEPTSVSSTNT